MCSSKWSEFSLWIGVLIGVQQSPFQKMDWIAIGIALKNCFWSWIVDCTPKILECQMPWRFYLAGHSGHWSVRVFRPSLARLTFAEARSTGRLSWISLMGEKSRYSLHIRVGWCIYKRHGVFLRTDWHHGTYYEFTKRQNELFLRFCKLFFPEFS